MQGRRSESVAVTTPVPLNPQKHLVCKYFLLLSPVILGLDYWRDIGVPVLGVELVFNGFFAVANPIAYVLLRRYGRPLHEIRYTLFVFFAYQMAIYGIELHHGGPIDLVWLVLIPFAYVFLGDQRIGVVLSVLGWLLGVAVYAAYHSFGLVSQITVGDFAHVQGVYLVATFFAAIYESSRSRSTERMLRQVSLDALTGLPNRRGFEAMLDEALESRRGRSEGAASPLGLIVFDLDDFKAVNDDLGHDAGDRVLREVARLTSDLVRASDAVCRWGGEEFVAIAPETAVAGAAILAEKIRALLSGSVLASDRRVTASFGVAELRPGESAASLFRRADEAMYEAKRSGKNRVVVAGPDHP